MSELEQGKHLPRRMKGGAAGFPVLGGDWECMCTRPRVLLPSLPSASREQSTVLPDAGLNSRLNTCK